MKNALALPALAPFYPGIVTARFFETWDFYTTHLGFATLHEDNQNLRLVHASGVQLAVLREETEGQPAELICAVQGRGFWLALDVADAAADYARLTAAGVEVASPLEDTASGERRFALRDPNGILIFVKQALSGNLARERQAGVSRHDEMPLCA